MPIKLDADVIICGGGHVGLTAALAMAGHNLQVHLINERPFEVLQKLTDDELRVSAITPVSAKIFRALKAWEEIKAWRVSPFRAIQVWENSHSAPLSFDSAEAGQTVLGYIIENKVMQTALFNQLKYYPLLKYDAPAKLIGFEQCADHIVVKLADGRQMRAKLIIGADGAQSHVRELANFSLRKWDYPQRALIATVRTEIPHAAIARQRFLPTGPLAFLPLSDPYLSSIVWSHTPEDAERLAQLSPAEFSVELDQAFDCCLGKSDLLSARLTYPLRLQHAYNYVQSRIALIGDAAHTIHPLAGQGLNLGLLDAITLAEVIVTAHEQQRDIGAMRTLRRYERWRKGANLAMLHTVDTLQHFFGKTHFPIAQLRQTGLQITEHCAPLKNWIMARAMGFGADLPMLINHDPRIMED